MSAATELRVMEGGAASAGGFVQVPNAIIQDLTLDPMARALYMVLLAHRNARTGQCNPSYARLASLAGTNGRPAAQTSIARWLRELVQAGYVAYERHGRENWYVFPDDPAAFQKAQRTSDVQKTTRAQRNAWRDEVIARDGGKCTVCGHDSVDRHHIVGRMKGGSDEPSNIISLCPNHHRMADRGLLSVEELRAALVARTSTTLERNHLPGASSQAQEVAPELASERGTPYKGTRRKLDSAPTERDAPGKPAVPARAEPTTASKASDTPNESAPSKPKPAASRPNKFGAVIDGIRAAGLPEEPVINRGRDAKAVNDCSASAEEIAAAVVAFFRGEWGTPYLRDHPCIWAICGDLAMYRRVNGVSSAGAHVTPNQSAPSRPGVAASGRGGGAVRGGVAGADEGSPAADDGWTERANRKMRDLLARRQADVPGVRVADQAGGVRLAPDGGVGA